jgi:AAA domain
MSKREGCPSLDIVRAIIANLSIILGTRPTVIVNSGHGLHPYWPISDGHITGGDISAARALIKRWGRLVAVVAENLGASVDNVYELARMMRAPGTLNNKTSGNGDRPLPVTAHADTGGPLTVAEVDERLAEVGILEEPGDTDAGTDPISKPDEWQFARRTCAYVAAILAHLPTDGPPPPEKAKKGRGRHQWAASVAVKLNCALRLGCISETDWNTAPDLLKHRLTELRATTGQTVPRHEIGGLFKLGQQRASCKTDEQARTELGGHLHTAPEPPPDFDDHHAGEYQPDDSAEHSDPTEAAITDRMTWLRINREARRRLDDEDKPPTVPPPVKNLDTLLAEPDTPVRYRIEGLAPTDSRIILSAQYKAGKTVIVGNLLRSLVDGDDFLGAFTVNSTAQHVVLIDDELSENTLRRWLRDQNIHNTAAVSDVVTLRGKVAAFNLLDDRCRDMWAARLRDLGCDHLMLDCLRPVLDALGLDENHDAGRFLAAYDALLHDAGIPDSALVPHMGHTSERARGDSRLQDWPDAIWRIVRETEEPDSPRYFTAYGRDVNVPEGRLGYDPATRRLTYAAGSRSDAKTEAAKLAVVKILAEQTEPLSVRGLQDALNGEHSQKAIRAGAQRAVKDKLVTVADGPRGAKLHSIYRACSQCGMPVAADRERHESCPPLGKSEDGIF